MKGQALMSLHEWESAIETLNEALKLSPNWDCALQTLGRAHLGFGQLQLAVKNFSKAVHLSPENSEFWHEDLLWAADLLKREKAGDRTVLFS